VQYHKNISNLVSDPRGYSQSEDILNIQLISQGAHTTVRSSLNANLTTLSTMYATCKPEHPLLPDPAGTLAHSQFSNLSAQQGKTLLFTNTHCSSRSVCWLSTLYITDPKSPFPPWLRPHTPQLNFTAAVCLLAKSCHRKAYAKLNLHRSSCQKNYQQPTILLEHNVKPLLRPALANN